MVCLSCMVWKKFRGRIIFFIFAENSLIRWLGTGWSRLSFGFHNGVDRVIIHVLRFCASKFIGSWQLRYEKNPVSPTNAVIPSIVGLYFLPLFSILLIYLIKL